MTDGGFDLNSLLEQAQSMQQQMMEAEQAQAEVNVTGTAGGGKVRIEASGKGEFKKVSIDPTAVDPDDIELLEELILAALRDTTAQVAATQAESMEGMQIPNLDGLLGGS